MWIARSCGYWLVEVFEESQRGFQASLGIRLSRVLMSAVPVAARGGAGVIGSCESPNVGAETELGSSAEQLSSPGIFS